MARPYKPPRDPQPPEPAAPQIEAAPQIAALAPVAPESPTLEALLAAEGARVVSVEPDGSVYAEVPSHRRGMVRFRFRADAGVLEAWSERRHDWRTWERD